MKNQLKGLFIVLAFLSIETNAQTPPTWLWAHKPTVSGINNEYASCVATDDSGNVFVAGSFSSSSISFGTTVLTNTGSPNFSSVLFLVKYNAAGNLIWAKSLTASDVIDPSSIILDSKGNIYLAGGFNGSSFSFGQSTIYNSNYNDFDIFLIKYDAAGNELWGRGAGAIDTQDMGNMVVDKNDNVILVGTFRYGMAFPWGANGGSIYNSYPNVGGYDFFVAKCDSSGDLIWVNSAGGVFNDVANSVAVDKDGNIVVCGTFSSNSIQFGPDTLYSSGANDKFFIAKYNSAGNALWGRTTSQYYSSALGVAVDTNKNIFLVGNFSASTMTIGTNTLTHAGGVDLFLVKYDSTGNVIWARQQDGGGTLDDIPKGIAVDANGSSYVFGDFASTSLTFGSTVLTNAGNANTSDLFLVKFDAAGNSLWTIRVGGNASEYGGGLTLDKNGNAIISGGFSSVLLSFGSTNFIYTGGGDMFVAKLNSGITGIDKEQGYTDAKIYPNPAKQQFNFDAGNLIQQGSCRIELLNQLSQLVYCSQQKSYPYSFDLSEKVKGGLYLVRILNEENRIIYSGRIVLE